MTHYRFGSKLTHAGCEMLPGGNDIEYIVIKEIKYKAEEEVGGRTEKGVWVAYFAPNPYTNLPIILNATNRKRLFKLSGNENIDELKNFPVRLTKEKCKDATDGGETVGLRISKIPAKIPSAPAPKKKPEITDANFDKAVEFLKTKSMEELRGFYAVSAEMEKRLMEKGEDLTQEGGAE